MRKLGYFLLIASTLFLFMTGSAAFGQTLINSAAVSPEIHASVLAIEDRGYATAFINTAAEHPCLAEAGVPGEILLRDPSPTLEESIKNFPVEEIQALLPPGWIFGTVGPGISDAELARTFAIDKVQALQFGCPKGQAGGVNRSFAMLRHAGNTTVDRIVFHSADWTAPVVGTSQDQFSFMFLNTMTDTNAFLQVGQRYNQDGTGTVVYTSSTMGNNASFALGLSYVVGHQYYHEIKNLGPLFICCPSNWWVGARDNTIGPSSFVSRFVSDSGTIMNLQTNNTGAFFENANHGANWHQGFTTTISVTNAWESDASLQNTRWDAQLLSEWNCQGSQVTNNVVTGTLVNGGTANFFIPNMELC